MTLVRLRNAALAAVPLTVLGVLAPAAHAAPAPTTFSRVGTGTQVPLLAGTTPVSTFVGDDLGGSTVPHANTATINVTYTGFSAPAKAAFQRAVNTWEQNVTSSVPINIQATYKPLPTNVLGSAGTNKVWQNNTTKTLYVDALANKLSGKQLDPSPDIIANFSSSFDNWYFGTGKSPSNTYDFQSVVTHEIGHGLGFLGAGDVTSGKGTISYNGGYAFQYAKQAVNAAGKSLISYPANSAALAQQLQSGKVFFTSPQVRSSNGGKPAKLFAPKTWQPGSSFSHLDEATYGPGNKNSLMTPILNPGEQIHSPGPIDRKSVV